MTAFMELLDRGWEQSKMVCLGLDPDVTRLPQARSGSAAGQVVEFNRQLVEASSDLVLAYKPQSAYYEALGADGLAALIDTVAIIKDLAPEVPVILDAKRADIGSSNEAYVTSAYEVIGADAITVHPYLGPEAMAPFLDRADKGVIVLCRTSNPGAGHYQDLLVDGQPLYQHIAKDVAKNWNRNGNCALVAGATAPKELAAIRAAAPNLPFLVPGIGAQGGDVEATINAGVNHKGTGLIINSSRALIYAYENDPSGDVSVATRQATQLLHDQINRALGMHRRQA